MSNVIHFERGKDYAFHMCKRCKQQTHKKRINYDALEKGKENEY